MEQQKSFIYTVVILGGIILVWLIYSSQSEIVSPPKKPQIKLVDGKVPPALSDFPMHRAFVDEKTCLKCHQEEKEINFQEKVMVAQKMPHEFREDCTDCHGIPE